MVDADELEKRFHQLSWKLHPDNFVRASEHERALSLECSSQLNDAFRTLRDPVSRVEYLLSQAGMRREGQHKQQAPPELLEEVFELNESLDELREARQAGGDPADEGSAGPAARKRAPQVRGEAGSGGHGTRRACPRSGTARSMRTRDRRATQKKLMDRMNEALNRRSYIRNLVQSVQKELAEA